VPFDVYWTKVLDSLKPQGRLCMDIRIEHYDQVANLITQALGHEPLILSYYGGQDHTPTSPTRGFRCVWQRQ
jgi:hypothetical protein